LRGLRQRIKKYIEQQPGTRVDYVEFFDEHTLRPVLPRKGSRLALAVYVGKTRLIDNGRM
jgi:pantothenate synthetase